MIKKIEDQYTIGNSIQALMDKCKELTDEVNYLSRMNKLTDEVNYLSRMNKRYINEFCKVRWNQRKK